MLKPIRNRKISDQVFDQVREQIDRGALAPGQKIMTERNLAETMHVSRTAVRDAIKRLVAQGFLVQRQGAGTFVLEHGRDRSPLRQTMNAEDASLHDLLEIRMGLECNAAALAARKADDEDLKALAASVEQLAAAHHEPAARADADVAFHMALAYATKNPLQISLMRQIHDILAGGIDTVLRRLYDAPDHIGRIIEQHRAIVAAIRDRDDSGADAAMRRHIEFVIDFADRTGIRG